MVVQRRLCGRVLESSACALCFHARWRWMVLCLTSFMQLRCLLAVALLLFAFIPTQYGAPLGSGSAFSSVSSSSAIVPTGTGCRSWLTLMDATAFFRCSYICVETQQNIHLTFVGGGGYRAIMCYLRANNFLLRALCRAWRRVV